jgi:N-acetyl-alpha-D-glucosaminyl L-malate synthase BshA
MQMRRSSLLYSGIVCYPTFGGSGVLATELGKALAQKGHHVHFITYQQPVRLNGFIPNIFYHEVQVPTYPLFDYPPYETALASTMVDVIRNNNIELLHVHYAIPHASAAYMAKKILEGEGIHIPVITTLHGTDITLVGRDKTYAPVVAFSINQSDAITAVSQNLRDETYKTFKIEKEIKVIHNFVDVQRFQPQADRCLPQSDRTQRRTYSLACFQLPEDQKSAGCGEDLSCRQPADPKQAAVCGRWTGKDHR